MNTQSEETEVPPFAYWFSHLRTAPWLGYRHLATNETNEVGNAIARMEEDRYILSCAFSSRISATQCAKFISAKTFKPRTLDNKHIEPEKGLVYVDDETAKYGQLFGMQSFLEGFKAQHPTVCFTRANRLFLKANSVDQPWRCNFGSLPSFLDHANFLDAPFCLIVALEASSQLTVLVGSNIVLLNHGEILLLRGDVPYTLKGHPVFDHHYLLVRLATDAFPLDHLYFHDLCMAISDF